MSGVVRFKGASKHGKSGWMKQYDTLHIRDDWADPSRREVYVDGELNVKKIQMSFAEDERQKYNRQLQSAEEAVLKWERLDKYPLRTEYLNRKRVDNFGCGNDGINLYVPLRDIYGKFWNIQTILPNGNKYFEGGAKKKSCFHVIGNESKPIVFCEGYATGASIDMACNRALCIVICFDAYNFYSVISGWRKKYGEKRKFYIACDDDRWKPEVGNVGIEWAKKCIDKFQCELIIPKFKDTLTQPTDFNDLHCLEGLGVVQDQIMEVFNRP